MIEQLFNIDLKKISNSSEKEALDRKENLDLFFASGLPNKKEENFLAKFIPRILNNKNKVYIKSASKKYLNNFILLPQLLL